MQHVTISYFVPPPYSFRPYVDSVRGHSVPGSRWRDAGPLVRNFDQSLATRLCPEIWIRGTPMVPSRP